MEFSYKDISDTLRVSHLDKCKFSETLQFPGLDACICHGFWY